VTRLCHRLHLPRAYLRPPASASPSPLLGSSAVRRLPTTRGRGIGLAAPPSIAPDLLYTVDLLTDAITSDSSNPNIDLGVTASHRS
jgi:hypothetical protein